jgi:hypothetical protein
MAGMVIVEEDNRDNRRPRFNGIMECWNTGMKSKPGPPGQDSLNKESEYDN